MERKQSIEEQVRRYGLFLAGMVMISFGIALLIKSALGVSPISSVPYTLSLIPFTAMFTVGEWTIIISLILIVAQLAMRPNDIHWNEIIVQFLISFVFGYCIDLALWLMTAYHPELYVLRVLTLVVGCCCLSFGCYVQLIGNVGMAPMDAFLKVLAEVVHSTYPSLRLKFDVAQTLASGAASLYFIGELAGVREGTVIAALCCGNMIRFYMSHLREFSNWLMPENALDEAAKARVKPEVSENHFVLTISHEYGSGGRTIARRIAHELGLAYFDTEIIQMAAKNSGYAASFIQENEERISSNALYKLYDWYSASIEVPVPEQIFNAEAQAIQEIASKNSCVIVGRLANYILRSHQNSLHIFVTADEEARVQRVMRKEDISQSEAETKISEFAIDRANHCQQFSNMEWGNGLNYDITIKSSKYGVDRTAAVLIDMIREFRQTMRPI